MNNENKMSSSLMSNVELSAFRDKTEKLMSNLEKNDVASAMECINEINEINSKSFYTVIGRLTRGLHNAISDLSISSSKDQQENNKTRVDLNYVITLTNDAAQKTLDMTEQSMQGIKKLTNNNDDQAALLNKYLAEHTPDQATSELINNLTRINQESSSNTQQVNENVAEIIMAQNYQDIASQSITKAINIINEVEDSLVALTQYANLLSKLSQFSGDKHADLNSENTEEIKSNIGKLNSMEDEHLDQNDVDNLLSSLGF